MKQRAGSVAGGGPDEGVSLAPDVESSIDSYAARFAGSLGDWFLQRQAASVIRLLSALVCRSVLEIGGGHGQLTGTLRGAGYEVIMQGSAFAASARVRRLYQRPPVPFVVARADLLPLPDRAVDAVVAVRIMAHIADPAGFLRECCRVADKMIVIDFPSRRSFNALSELLFSFKRSVEGDTRRFRIFRSSGAGVPGSGARLSTGRSVPSVLLSDGGASPARLAYRRGSAREHVSPARPDAPIRLADHRLVPSQRRAVTGQVGRGDLRNVCAREAHAHALG